MASKEYRDTRRQVMLEQLVPVGESEEQRAKQLAETRALVSQLASAGLVSTSKDAEGEKVEVAHEALIRYWPQLREALEGGERETALLRQRVGNEAREWSDKRSRDLLKLRGEELSRTAQRLREQTRFPMNQAETDYLDACLRHRRLETRRQRGLLGGLTVVFVAALVFAGFALWQWRRADMLRHQSLARQLAAQSDSVRGIYGDSLVRSLLLALESRRYAPTLEGYHALRAGLELLPRRMAQVSKASLVEGAVFSPDGKRWAVITEDGTVEVRETSAPANVPPTIVHRGAKRAIFSPNWRYLAMLQDNQQIEVLDFTSRKSVVSFPVFNRVEKVLFSPEEQYIAISVQEHKKQGKRIPGSVVVWELAHKTRVLNLPDLSLTDHGLLFSPKGRYLAIESLFNFRSQSQLYIWELHTRRRVGTLTIEPYTITTRVAFDPEEHSLVAAGSARTGEQPGIRMWELASWRERPFMGQTGTVMALQFNPDGRLTTVGGDHIARIWDFPQGKEPKRVNLYATSEEYVFSQEGAYLAAQASGFREVPLGDETDTAWVWDLRSGAEIARFPLLQFGRNITRVIAFDPTKKHLAIDMLSVDSRIAQLWEMPLGWESGPFTLPDKEEIAKVLFSPNGRTLTAVGNSTVQTWELAGGRPLSSHGLHSDYRASVDISWDSKHLAIVSSQDKSISVKLYSLSDLHFENSHIIVSNTSTIDTPVLTFSGGPQSYLAIASNQRIHILHLPNLQEAAFIDCPGSIVKLVGDSEDSYLRVLYNDADRNIRLGVYQMPDGAVLLDAPVFVREDRSIDDVYTQVLSARYFAARDTNKKTLWIKEIPSGRSVAKLEHNHEVEAVAFGPEGNYMAVYGEYMPFYLWRWAESRPIAMNPSRFLSVRFRADGEYTYTVGRDNSFETDIQFWETGTGLLQGAMRLQFKNEEIGFPPVFCPDGKTLAFPMNGPTVKLFPYRPEDLEREARLRLLRNLTPAEWEQYLPGEPYHETIPRLPKVAEGVTR